MKLLKIILALLTALLLTTGILATASAAAGESEDYQKRVAQYEAMKARSIWINISNNDAWYDVKASKLYGRKITGVAEDGSWILGGWEMLDNNTNFDRKVITVNGTYFAFAYSFDITWGTDWPYSGIFYSNVDVHPETIRIMLSGTCRMAGININVDGRTVVNESNCSSHSEWKP